MIANYDVGNEIIYNTEGLKFNLCDCNDACIPVGGNTTIAGNITAWVAMKKCAPFTKCITKIDGTIIDDVEDLDLVMSIYNLLEDSSNYSDTTVSLWFYSKFEATDFNAYIANNATFNSFKYKSKLIGSTAANGILENTTIVVPLKYLSNIWRSVEMPLN